MNNRVRIKALLETIGLIIASLIGGALLFLTIALLVNYGIYIVGVVGVVLMVQILIDVYKCRVDNILEKQKGEQNNGG